MVKIKDQLKKIIFGTETFGGRLFDILLIFAIITSVLIVMLDSVSEYHNSYGKVFSRIEWIFTILLPLNTYLEFIASDYLQVTYLAFLGSLIF